MSVVISMISGLLLSFLGIVGWFSLIMLPGSWVTFGLPLLGFPFWIRLLIGTALSPFVVCVQFYALRIFGASFEMTVPLLVMINLPVLYLLYKRRGEISIPEGRTLLSGAMVLLVPFICLVPQLLDSQARMFTGHTWIQSDLVYSLANGELWLDDPELAGVKLAYPWAAHVFQSVLSYLVNSAPASSYIWTNLVWMLCFSGFAAYIVAELGGNRFSQITSAIWLFFGVNFVGYVLGSVLQIEIAGKLWTGGDYRYTPWMLKFYFFEQSIFGLCMFSAVVYLLIKPRYSMGFGNMILICILLCGIGVVYPILFLPAAAIVCVKPLTTLMGNSNKERVDWVKQSIWFGVIFLIAGAVTFTHVKLLTVDRINPAVVFPSISWDFAIHASLKVINCLIVLSILLGAFVFLFPKFWKARCDAVLILGAGALASVALNALLEIPYWANEYKFVFTAAICLSPFPALALQSLMERLKNKAVPAFALIALILATPLAHKLYADFPWTAGAHPVANATSFDLRLDDSEPLSALYDTIRQKTPVNSILVMERSEVHVPTLTRRKLFAPPLQDNAHPGVGGISSIDLLARVKGYGEQLIEGRRLVVNDLFNSLDTNRREQSFERILQLKQPVVIILEIPRHAALQEWLEANGRNRALYADGHVALWLIEARDELE
jgi:hypothetical protein